MKAARHATAPEATLRWRSSSDSVESVAVEFPEAVTSLDDLCSALASATPTLKRCALAIARLDVSEPAVVQGSLNAMQAMKLPFRVCLAVDSSVLRALTHPFDVPDHVGLLLDGVEANTPMSDVAHQSLEAIRFETSFVRTATGSLRSLCVLNALLHLARDLGLCTFGPAMSFDSACGSEPRFDYISGPGSDQ